MLCVTLDTGHILIRHLNENRRLESMIRTKNGRFITERVRIDAKTISKVLSDIKKNKKLTWKELAHYFNVSEHVVRYEWRHAKTTIPMPVVKKLEKFGKRRLYGKVMPVWWGQKIDNRHISPPVPLYSFFSIESL